MDTIPFRPILIFQQNQIAFIADAGFAARVVEQHQRQEALGLGLIRKQRGQAAGEANSVGDQVPAHELRAPEVQARPTGARRLRRLIRSRLVQRTPQPGNDRARTSAHNRWIVIILPDNIFLFMNGSLGKNPFRPGVGTRPLFLAGRDAPIRRFLAALRAAPEQPANMRLTGLRGVGKTVLLAEFEEQARNANWAVASLELNPRHNEEQSLASELRQLLAEAQRDLSRIEKLKHAIGKTTRALGRLGVTYNDVKVTVDPAVSTEHARIIGEALVETVEAARKQGRVGFLLLLDEAQAIRDDKDRKGEHPLSLLISVVSSLQRKDLALGLVLCGLPTLTGNLLRARSYTERMFRGEEVGRLESSEAAAAFTEPLKSTTVKATPGLVRAVVREVEGYPYFIQLWGAELWDAAVAAESNQLTESILRVATPDIYRRLDIDFYEPRIATLTPAEQDVLIASANCKYPPLETIDLQDVIDKTPGNINVLLGRLVDAGVVYRLRKGQYEYTAPKFREYLIRRVKQVRRP